MGLAEIEETIPVMVGNTVISPPSEDGFGVFGDKELKLFVVGNTLLMTFVITETSGVLKSSIIVVSACIGKKNRKRSNKKFSINK